MLKRIVAVTAITLALGLTACDKGGQEQAQTPKNRDQNTTQSPPSSAAPNQPTANQPTAPGATDQAPSTPPPEGTSRGTGSGNQ